MAKVNESDRDSSPRGGRKAPRSTKKEEFVSFTINLFTLEVSKVRNGTMSNPVVYIIDSEEEDKDVPEVIEDDEDDVLLNTTFDFSPPEVLNRLRDGDETDETGPRRGTRVRKTIAHTGFVPTVEAIPPRGRVRSQEDYAKNDKPSYQFSLSSLLREKKERDRSGYNIEFLEKSLDNDMELGDIDDPFTDFDLESVTTNIIPEYRREHLQRIIAEEQRTCFERQLNFFESIPERLPDPILDTNDFLARDTVYRLLLEASFVDDASTHEILCSNWISQQYKVGWELPVEVVKWLLKVVSFESNEIFAGAAYHTLKRLTEICTSAKMSSCEIRIPFLFIFEILEEYGAPPALLGCRCRLTERAIQMSSVPESSPCWAYLDNLRLLLRIMVPLVGIKWLSFSADDDIRKAISALVRLSFDVRLRCISSDLELAIGSLLDAIDGSQWTAQVKLLCKDITWSIGGSLYFNIALLERLPVSKRGLLLRRLLAFNFLLSKKAIPWSLDKIDVSQPISLEPILILFSDSSPTFKITKNTDYDELAMLVSILGFALDDESQLRQNKQVTEELISKIKQLQGKIVDHKAAFIDRTKSKDVIQRLFMRLYYVVRDERRSSSSLKNFTSSKNTHNPLNVM
ncbi:10641_t:CDS:10 [Paraglomus brasilianum]|uniref:10641_t:CDS:1 n=1 Tax=Paraglomus brasilianum TaxID=144538 RepID=A0A9N9D817_9GLOM|nr:10641_t:CDS:10 [Paraglomus brasilianum]